MSRQTEAIEEQESENLPAFGAGSEFGRERREEARKKRRGFVTKPKDREAAPWNLKIGGKSGKRWLVEHFIFGTKLSLFFSVM